MGSEGGGPTHADHTGAGNGHRRKATAVTERITRTTVRFAHPFALPGLDGEQPPGTYAVETTEATIDGLSFVAYRRVSTTIILTSSQFGPESRQVVTIDPLDLEAAQRRDAAKTGHS